MSVPSAQRSRACLRHLTLIVAGLCLTVLGPGCRVIKAPVKAITPSSKKAPKDPAEVEGLVQRFAEDFGSRTSQAIDEYVQLIGTPEAKSQALRWKVAGLSYSISIASGPNPYGNLVDFIGMISLNRSALEEYWIHTPQGAAFEPWLQSSRVLESNAWQIAAVVFHPPQIKELRDAIEHYRRERVGSQHVLFSRPQEFVTSLKIAAAGSDNPSGLFGFIGLDPTMGLDPAVQEVTRTRLFAERAMFTLPRMPVLIRLQTEILMDDLLNKPETRQTLTNVGALAESSDRISRAAESLSQTAAGLPDKITSERQAILAALDDQAGKLATLAAELNRTLVSGEKMSTSLNTTLTTFDGLMKRFGVGEESTNAAPADTNSAPFNILDYARTAEQLSGTARELDVLLKDLGSTADSPAWTKRIGDVATVSRQASADAKSVLNRAFLLGAGLILLTFACAIVYRRLNPRR